MEKTPFLLTFLVLCCIKNNNCAQNNLPNSLQQAGHLLEEMRKKNKGSSLELIAKTTIITPLKGLCNTADNVVECISNTLTSPVTAHNHSLTNAIDSIADPIISIVARPLKQTYRCLRAVQLLNANRAAKNEIDKLYKKHLATNIRREKNTKDFLTNNGLDNPGLILERRWLGLDNFDVIPKTTEKVFANFLKRPVQLRNYYAKQVEVLNKIPKFQQTIKYELQKDQLAATLKVFKEASIVLKLFNRRVVTNAAKEEAHRIALQFEIELDQIPERQRIIDRNTHYA